MNFFFLVILDGECQNKSHMDNAVQNCPTCNHKYLEAFLVKTLESQYDQDLDAKVDQSKNGGFDWNSR